MIKRIQSRENAWFKSLVKLSASARERRLRGRAILDGPHLIEAWRAGGGVAEAIVASETGSSRPEVRALLESAAAETRVLLPDRLFDALAQVVTPVGILAVIATPAPASVPEEIGDAILLEGLQDAGNLGSILRTAAAAAIARIFLSPGSAFAWSPKVLRAGMGAHFALSIHENVRSTRSISPGPSRGSSATRALASRPASPALRRTGSTSRCPAWRSR